MSEDVLLSVEHLKKYYPVRSGLLRRVSGHVKAVDGVSFDVHEGETFGLVGESGCGKSTTASTILGLEAPTDGTVIFDGADVSSLDSAAERQFRRRAQIVFQDPNSAFDPRLTVGESVREPLSIHGLDDTERANDIVADLFERIGLSASDVDRYPHEFSDGQKQRIALARALVLNPDLLVADEPVSALDVSVQAEILSLLAALRSELGLSMVLISHDLGVVRELADRVGVMYLGRIVERGPVEQVFEDPQHPYTQALLESIPIPDPAATTDNVALSGDVPDPSNPPTGCSFHTRCPQVIPPEDYDIGETVYRAVLDFRLAVLEESVEEAHAEPAAIRAAYDLPSTLDDPEAEAIVDGAIDAVRAGDFEVAGEALAAFESVCERSDPDLEPTGSGHPAACHRTQH